MKQKLSIKDHSRDIAGLKYVYPVISRRAGGLSIGINFNTNNACNWRCVYCQVPNLIRGSAPLIDFELLEQELRLFLNQVIYGDFFEQYEVAEAQRVIKDIAISGNGEPTSLKAFDKAVSIIGKIATEFNVLPHAEFVLITNGSFLHLPTVQEGLKELTSYGGQVWFKLDSATECGRKKVNNSFLKNEKVLRNLAICADLCETSLQTCVFNYLPEEDVKVEFTAYVDLLKQNQAKIKKIMLYTLARPSLQPEADLLSKMEEERMLCFSEKLRALNYEVGVSL